MIVTKINTSTALTTDSSNNPMSKPTTVAAKVAAACGTVRPSIKAVSPLVSCIRRLAIRQATVLPPSAAKIKSPASFNVSGRTITLGWSSIPTETRNTGMNTAEPKIELGGQDAT